MSQFVCDGLHPHTHLEGNIRGRGSRTELAEDYPVGMAKELARCLAYDEFAAGGVYAAEPASGEDVNPLDKLIEGNNEGEEPDGRHLACASVFFSLVPLFLSRLCLLFW